MPVYNGEAYLEDQIQSIIEQKKVSVKIFLLDDGSIDRTFDIIKKFRKKISIENIDNKKRHGSAGQAFFELFTCMDFQHFDYVALCDQDDIWNPMKLCESIELMQLEDAQLCSGAVTCFWTSGREKKIKSHATLKKFDYLFEGAGQGCTYVLTSDFATEVRSFIQDNRLILRNFFHHDWLIYILCRTQNHKWSYLKESYLKYRQHNNNETGARWTIKGVKSRLRKISNNWYGAQIKKAAEISDISVKVRPGITLPEKYHQMLLSRRLGEIILFHSRRRASERVFLWILYKLKLFNV